MVHTIEALREAAHEVAVVAPVTAPRSWLQASVRSLVDGTPLSVARHSIPATRATVERLLAEGGYDVVHAEQAQAVPQCAPAFARGIPVVLRAQNVESDLWAAAASRASFFNVAPRLEAARFGRWEAEVVRRADATIALTTADADRLGEMSGALEKIETIAAPFPAMLPPSQAALRGAPALILFGSAGWLPNREGSAWFVREIWPLVARLLPRAVLHLFTPGPPPADARIDVHPPLDESRGAFDPAGILIVPLRIGSGVRIKILEAWARGVPVVATPQAAQGLDATDGRELLLATDPPAFAAALEQIDSEQGLRSRLIASARQRLRDHHDPVRVASALAAVYERLAR